MVDIFATIHFYVFTLAVAESRLRIFMCLHCQDSRSDNNFYDICYTRILVLSLEFFLFVKVDAYTTII